MKAPSSFEFENFIIVLILSFLLFNRLFCYVADFSTIKHHSRIDIVFLTIFFVMLVLPMSKIDDSEKAKYENRMLALYKSLITEEGKINFNYGKDFESWFNDRFNLREVFIDISHSLKKINKIYSFNDTCYDKKYNILYNRQFFGLQKKEPINKYVDNLQRFNKYCEDNNIKLYLLIVPRHANFYQYTIVDKKAEKKDYAEDIIDTVVKATNVKIIYPKEQMIELNKTTPAFFATDHHWTKKGTFICYKELMNTIKKDFSNINILDESSLEVFYDNRVQATSRQKFYNGHTFSHLRLNKSYAKKLLNRTFIYYKNPLAKNIESKEVLFETDSYIKDNDELLIYPNPNKLKTLLIGNSFAENLIEFLPYSFEKTLRLYDNYRKLNMHIYEPLIEEYKPDIIILNFHTACCEHILNMYKESIEEGEE